MKKKVTNIEVVEYVAERGNRKGEHGKYVRLTLENRGSNWIAAVNKNAEYLNITRPQNIVDIWLGFAEQMKGGKKVEEVVPDEYRLIDRVFKVNVPLDVKCLRLYRKDEVDKSTGKVLHRKNDYYTLDDGKTPAIYDSLEVLAVQYEDDDTGEMKWLQTPESIVRDMINRGYYRPVVANAISETISPEPEGVEAGATSSPAQEEESEPTLEELQAKLEAMKAKQQSA